MRPGVVDLRDLARRYMWDARAIESFIAATGLDVAPTPAWRSFAPPRVLVVIAPLDLERAGLLARSRPWLEACEHVVIVRDRSSNEPIDEEEWRAALAGIDHAVFDDAAAALGHAVGRAASLPSMPAPAEPEAFDLELPLSGWHEVGGDPRMRYVPARLAMRDGRAVLLDATGTAIDLAAPRGPIQLAFTHVDVLGRPIAGGDDLRNGMWPTGCDPVHPIAWRGSRMMVFWMLARPHELGFLSATDHEFPTGPARKLWGYKDNDPVFVSLAPDATAFAMTFEHDVTVSSHVPIAWHRAGAVDVAAFAREPHRATFFARTEEFIREISTEDLLDEDNRDLAPVVVLGPSKEVRYAVALDHQVVRILGPHDSPRAEVIGGPGDGFAVFDAEHQLVRFATGRLLGGWFRHATVEDRGSLWREDLATGARTLLCDATRVACADPRDEAVVEDALREGRHDAVAELRANYETVALGGPPEVVPIPGTRNILELRGRFLRVV